MKGQFIIAFVCSFCCFNSVDAQKIQPLKEIRKMMENARDSGSLPCLVVMPHDTIWGSKLDWKWNKKLKAGEWHLDEQVFDEERIFYYQDKDGYHAVLHYSRFNGEKFTEDLARIIKAKIDVYVSNWDSRGSGATFDPHKGYIGSGTYSRSNYYIFSSGTMKLVTYGSLKEVVSDNKAALVQYKIEFNAGESPQTAIFDWGAIKRVLDIYNQ